jgi:hypothetical protein
MKNKKKKRWTLRIMVKNIFEGESLEDLNLGGMEHSDVSNSFYFQFEGLTAVIIKSTIFWNVTPCSPEEEL